jgi:hypothetical protein
MARQTRAEWQAYLDATFLTGVIGNISAAKMRGFGEQIAANSSPAYAVMNSATAHTADLTATPTKFIIFDEAVELPDPSPEFSINLLLNQIDFALGWVYELSVSLIVSGGNNQIVLAQFYRDNGTGFEPEGDIAETTLRNASSPVSLTIPAFPFQMADNSTIELRLWSGSGNHTLNILNTDKKSWMICRLVPWAV